MPIRNFLAGFLLLALSLAPALAADKGDAYGFADGQGYVSESDPYDYYRTELNLPDGPIPLAKLKSDAGKGIPRACLDLGLAYYYGVPPSPMDSAQADRYLRLAVDKGEKCDLCDAWYQGVGLPKDEAQALKCYMIDPDKHFGRIVYILYQKQGPKAALAFLDKFEKGLKTGRETLGARKGSKTEGAIRKRQDEETDWKLEAIGQLGAALGEDDGGGDRDNDQIGADGFLTMADIGHSRGNFILEDEAEKLEHTLLLRRALLGFGPGFKAIFRKYEDAWQKSAGDWVEIDACAIAGRGTMGQELRHGAYQPMLAQFDLDLGALVKRNPTLKGTAQGYQTADQRLNRVYKVLRDRLKGKDEYVEEGCVKDLVDAEKSWIAYRDQEVAFYKAIFPKEYNEAMKWGILTGLTEGRSTEIELESKSIDDLEKEDNSSDDSPED